MSVVERSPLQAFVLNYTPARVAKASEESDRIPNECKETFLFVTRGLYTSGTLMIFALRSVQFLEDETLRDTPTGSR
jgi:hypothetical protein